MKKFFIIFSILSQFLLFGFAAAKSDGNIADYANFPFWQKFNDEILLNLLSKSLENNLDIKIINLKVKESEKIVKISLGNELPAVNFSGEAGKIFTSSDTRLGYKNPVITSYTQSNFLLPINVNYEIDIWGKNRLKTKSYKQSLKMLQQDEKTACIHLTSTLAIDYYNLIKIDKFIELENKLYDLSKQYENYIINKEKFGLASKNDILNAKENTFQIKNNLNNLITQKEILENQISYLLGDKLFKEIERKNFNSTVNLKNIPNELNSEIILNRPDVIIASENIIKRNLEAKIAKKDLLPSFTINGTFGFRGYNNLNGIFKNHTGLAQLFILPELNIFDGSKRFNLMKLRQLELEEAKKEYEKTILVSIQEVNDTLAILKKENRNYEISKDILDIENEKLRMKLNNKTHGLSNELECLIFEEAKILSEKKMTENKINTLISYINLFKTTGGADFSQEKL